MLRVSPVPPTSAVFEIAIAASLFMSALIITSLAIVVAFPEEVISPVRLALVVTLPDVRLDAVPDTLVITPDAGVPRAGVTSVGRVANTAPPVPVSSVRAERRLALDGVPMKVATPEPRLVIPVPPLATGSVPDTPVASAIFAHVGLLFVPVFVSACVDVVLLPNLLKTVVLDAYTISP